MVGSQSGMSFRLAAFPWDTSDSDWRGRFCFGRLEPRLRGSVFPGAVLIKSFRVKRPAPEPDLPKGFEDLALRVEAGVADGAGARFARLVEGFDGIGAGGRFAGGPPGVVAQVLEFAVAAPVEPLVAERFAVAGALGDAQSGVFPKLMFVREAFRGFDDGAKDVSGDRADPGETLELAHFPEVLSDALEVAQGLFPLAEGLVVLEVEAAEDAGFFVSGKLGEILCAPGLGKNFESMELEDAPLPVARFDQRFEFALSVAPVQELVEQGAVDLAGAIGAHPDFFELAQAQKQTHPRDIGFVVLLRVGVDQAVVPRFADDESLDQRPGHAAGPAGERAGFEGEVEWAALPPQDNEFSPERLGLGEEADRRLGPALMVHAPEDAALAMQIEGGIKRCSFHNGLIVAGEFG